MERLQYKKLYEISYQKTRTIRVSLHSIYLTLGSSVTKYKNKKINKHDGKMILNIKAVFLMHFLQMDSLSGTST